MWLDCCPARGPEWDLSLYLWGLTHKEMDSHTCADLEGSLQVPL